MSAGALVARNAKAVVSVLGGVLSVGGAAAALSQYAPPAVAAWSTVVLTVLEALRAVNVWLVRNTPNLEHLADEGAALVGEVERAAERSAAPAAPPAP